MCQNHTQPVLSQFRKHVCENLGGEAVEFVDVQKEWLAFGFGDVFAAVSGIGQTADDQSTQDICNVGTQSSLRKVDDEHLPVVSDKTKKSLIGKFIGSSGRTDLPPLIQSGVAVDLEIVPAVEMSFLIEVVVNGGVN